jgi:(p)ppGpp synthase/HD superfamily hydrolase
MIGTGTNSREAIEADQAAIEEALETYPKLQYSKIEVRQAGKILAGDIRFDDDSDLERKQAIIETFRIANNWREVHFVPIRSMRALVSRRARDLGLSVLHAARVKRISSIRKKLARPEGIHLDRINDIAGCRAVLDDIASVRTLVDAIRSDFPHNFTGREWDYIKAPKPDGYRSHHMVFEYSRQGDKSHYNGLRVELQVRTRLQHSWATAVEAVGLYRNEDMKAGQGNQQWLRLFCCHPLSFGQRLPV